MKEFNLPKIFNWQKASEKIVKKYVAQLSQSGTDAPVATELYNDTGVAFTYEYSGDGEYYVVANKPIFTEDQKVQITFANTTAANETNFVAIPLGFIGDPNAAAILTSESGVFINNLLGNPSLAQATLEITIYN
jgi:hypothetical protein